MVDGKVEVSTEEILVSPTDRLVTDDQSKEGLRQAHAKLGQRRPTGGNDDYGAFASSVHWCVRPSQLVACGGMGR